MKEQNKVNVADAIEFHKTVTGALGGTLHFANGHSYTFIAAPDMKQRQAKTRILDNMPDRALEMAAEMNTTIILD